MENITINLLIILTLICIIIIFLFYYWAIKRANYFNYHNVPNIGILPFMGNLKDVLFQRKSIYDLIYNIYFDKKIYNQPIAGFQLFHKPGLLILEPELIKRILIKDFNLFTNRHAKSDPHSDKMGSVNLFLARNSLWRQLRTRLSPNFSISKIKNMFYIIKEIGNDLNQYLLKKCDKQNNKTITFDVRDLSGRYTNDVMARCIFGVQAKSISNPESEFRTNGKCFFEFNFFRSIEFMTFFLLPDLVTYFKFKFFSRKTEKFLRDSINFVMDEREKSGTIKNDLIDTLVQLKKEDENKISKDELIFDRDVLVAQAGAFFLAGFEGTSSVLSFTLYELAKHQNCQDRLRQEIKENLIKVNGELTYEIINEMEYLQNVTQEVLRLYPNFAYLERECAIPKGMEYSLEPYHKFKIPHGMPVFIPLFPIQRDPKFYTDPMAFDPERFSKKNTKLLTNYTLLPFGIGPRNCVAERLGWIQLKVGIINFLKNHRVTPTKLTPTHMTFDKKSFTMQPENILYLNFINDPIL